ncbi:MAG: MBL fold metallo-hydrolase [Desulfovibrionaceae bacterium]|jgi:metallo-beta-lactamase family protein|nr:MBL fold metallo-hydrolase [Desulfovibrionaceae bacterium]
MKIRFMGAAQTVTGSCYVIETGGTRFAVDCGMHQGNAEIEKRNYSNEYDPSRLDFILVTHAHIDHSGLLPRVHADGFRGPVYCTPPTRDLLEIMLLDSAHIQEMEAEWQNKKRTRHGDARPVEPLYTSADAEAVTRLIRPVDYREPFEPAGNVRVTYRDAGHILGSAFLLVEITENGDTTRLVFSGDLGRPDQLLIRDPSELVSAHYLFMESTYGDREHKDERKSRDELAEAIAYSYGRGEKVIIPAFAVERTQEVLYSLHLLAKDGRLPADMPVYVDSPLAIKATEVFRKNSKYFDEQTQALYAAGEDPLRLPNLRYTQETRESQAINTTPGPAVVISASGMCNAGRIKHHLRHNLWREGASIVFVGYQGQGTPGRRIVDGVKSIRILNEEVAVNARIFTIGGFSAHAGQSQIMAWLESQCGTGVEVFLVHGEERAQKTLAALIREKCGLKVRIPAYLEEVTLKAGTEPAAVAPPAKARPEIDWTYLAAETEAKIAELNKRLAHMDERSWVDQSDVRDRLLEIHSDLAGLISEL